METHSTEARLAADAHSMGLRLLTFNQEHAPARSVALIMAETAGAFPLAGGRALAAGFLAGGFIGGVGGRIPVDLCRMIRGENLNGEEHKAAQEFVFY